MTDIGQEIRFALLGHPADFDHFVRLAESSAEPSATKRLNSNRKTFTKLIEWMPSYVTRHRPVASLRSCSVEGRLIVCPFLPDQIQTPQELKRAYGKIVAGCKLAKELGAAVISLGGFTSILEGANGNELAEQLGLVITSGNSLTGALAIEQLTAVLRDTGRRIEKETVAVIGATGDIGRICALMLARSAQRMILVARNRVRLEALREQFDPQLSIEISTDPYAAHSAGIIIAAASAPTPIVSESELASGAIVCDLGYPKNLSDAPDIRTDVLIFSGGLANLPGPLDLQSYTGLPTRNLLFGCFCEGIVLAARQDNMKLATAQGNAEVDRAKALLRAAAELGIEPAPPYRGSRLLQPEALADFSRIPVAQRQ